MKQLLYSTFAAALIAPQCVAAQERPNILFCIADDASFPFWGAYGTEWVRTPNIDRVAANGTLYMNCYTPNAKSGPSRSCILTGRNSWQLEAACNHNAFWPSKFKSFAEAMNESGYVTARCGKGWAPGNPGMKNGKKRELIGELFNGIKLTPPTASISNIDYAANFEAFLKQRDKSKPFFFWYGGIEPHRSYEYGSGVKKGGYNTSDIDSVLPYWEDCEESRNDMLDFAFELEHFDTHLGRMLDELEREGLLESTMIVVTADNGMPFPRVKGQTYHYSNHLPLAIMWGEGMSRKGVKCDDFVNFIDLAPTFLEAAEINPAESGMQPIEGESILELIKSGKNKITSEREYVVLGKERHDIGRPNDEGYPIRAILTKEYLYIRNFETDRWPSGNPETGYLNCDGGAIKSYLIERRFDKEGAKYWELNFGKRPAEELYDLKRDPHCITNLATEESYTKTKKRLQKELFEELRRQGDPRMEGRGDVFESYPYGNVKYQGYYNKVKRVKKLQFPGWIKRSDVDKR